MSNTCRYCGAPIAWSVGANGKSLPVNPDGSAHRCQSQTSNTEPHRSVPAADPAPMQTNTPPKESRSVITHHENITGGNIETTVRYITERPDSLEIGTAGKGGAMKIYMDYADPEDCEIRIRNAIRLRELANTLLSGVTSAGPLMEKI